MKTTQLPTSRSNRLKQLSASVLLPLTFVSLSNSALAAEIDVKITNLTQGIYFTPLLITAHSDDLYLYKPGMAASTDLQKVAEGGDISGFTDTLSSTSADSIANPAEGLLAPGASVETMLTTMDDNTHLSVVSMLLPTNDGFVGLDSWEIPTEVGTYTIYLNGYDAGTEANDEIINGGGMPGAAGIPVDPSGNNGTGATGVTMSEETQVVHIHRGNLGDDDIAGGKSDLDNKIHRWLNPVAKVTVTVK